LETARACVEDVSRVVGDLRGRVEADPARLDAMIRRQDEIARLKKKYGASVPEILARRETLKSELETLENSEQRIEDLEAAWEAARRKLEAACGRLHKLRAAAAGKLEAELLKELKVLGMPQARFCVSVEEEEGRLGPTGSDEVEFLIAPNPGEPMKTVRSIASGGELSRVMLALKTVFAETSGVPILVFDEIDAGVGGTVARCVAQRLASLGRRRQVLCVTHLAQVAGFASAHWRVSKEVAHGRTSVRAERLEGERRLEFLAQLLGGRAATEASRKHAQELLESSTL
jgi:DNA repair protein RecN (Recombination protein N)